MLFYIMITKSCGRFKDIENFVKETKAVRLLEKAFKVNNYSPQIQ